MNASSILLEGTRRVSQGRMVRLNLSQVKNYSLFPGQVCLLCMYVIHCKSSCVCVCVCTICLVHLRRNTG